MTSRIPMDHCLFLPYVTYHFILPWNSLVTWFLWYHTVLIFLCPLKSSVAPLKSLYSLWPWRKGPPLKYVKNLSSWDLSYQFLRPVILKVWFWTGCLSITWELLKCKLNIGPDFWSTESKILKMESNKLSFNKPSMCFWCRIKFENHYLKAFDS